MKRVRKVKYKTAKKVYFIMQGVRPIYYMGKLLNNKVCSKTRISRDKFEKDIARLKKLNNKSSYKK